MAIAQEEKLYLTPFNADQLQIYWFDHLLPTNSWSKEHQHDWFELLYVSNGCIVVCTHLGNWIAPPNRAVWIPPKTPHRWYVPCDSKSSTIWLNPELLWNVRPDFQRPYAVDITPLAREMLLYLNRPAQGASAPQHRLLAALPEVLLDLEESAYLYPVPEDERLIKLCAHIMAMPGNNSTLAQWSRELGMSERNLARLFRRQTGASFHEWRHAQRMSHARKRLEAGDSVTVTALECGYSSISAFIAVFKRVFGVSPGALSRQSAVKNR